MCSQRQHQHTHCSTLSFTSLQISYYLQPWPKTENATSSLRLTQTIALALRSVIWTLLIAWSDHPRVSRIIYLQAPGKDGAYCFYIKFGDGIADSDTNNRYSTHNPDFM